MIFNKALAQVMTSPKIVKDMLNLLETNCFTDLENVFLEPSCGTGNFLIEVLKRKIRCNKNNVKNANEAYMLVLKSLQGIKAIDIDIKMVRYSQYKVAKFVQRWLRLWKPEFNPKHINYFKILDVLLAQEILSNIIQGDFLKMSKE